jgi:hypothetical protein
LLGVVIILILSSIPVRIVLLYKRRLLHMYSHAITSSNHLISRIIYVIRLNQQLTSIFIFPYNQRVQIQDHVIIFHQQYINARSELLNYPRFR